MTKAYKGIALVVIGAGVVGIALVVRASRKRESVTPLRAPAIPGSDPWYGGEQAAPPPASPPTTLLNFGPLRTVQSPACATYYNAVDEYKRQLNDPYVAKTPEWNRSWNDILAYYRKQCFV